MFKLKELIVILCLVNLINCSDHFGFNNRNLENRRRSYVYKKQINHHHHYPEVPKRRRKCYNYSSRPSNLRSRYSDGFDRKSDNFLYENSDRHNYFEDLVREVHRNYQSPNSLKSQVFVSKLPNHYTNLDKTLKLISSPEIKRIYPNLPTFQQNEMENNFYNPYYQNIAQRPIRNLWKSEPLPGQIMYPPTVPRFLPIPLRNSPNYNKIDYRATTTTKLPIINQPNWIPFYLHEAVIPTNKIQDYNLRIPQTTPVNFISTNQKTIKIPKNSSTKLIKTRPEDYPHPQHNYSYNKISQSTDLRSSNSIKPVYEDVNEVNDFVVSPIPQPTTTMRTKYVLKNPINSEIETTTPINLRVKRPEMKLVTIQRGAILMKKNDKNVIFQSRVGESNKDQDENIYYVTPTPQKKIMHAKNSGFKMTSGKSLPNKIYTLGHLISHPNPAQAGLGMESMTSKKIIPHTIYGHHKLNNQFEFYKNYSNSGKLKEINPKIITKRTNLEEKNSLTNINDGYVDAVLDQNYDILTVKDDGFKIYDDGNEINENSGRSFEDLKTVDVHPNVKWILLNQRYFVCFFLFCFTL